MGHQLPLFEPQPETEDERLNRSQAARRLAEMERDGWRSGRRAPSPRRNATRVLGFVDDTVTVSQRVIDSHTRLESLREFNVDTFLSRSLDDEV